MKSFAVFAVVLSCVALSMADKKWNMKCDGKDLNMKEFHDHSTAKACLDKYAPAAEPAADATDEDKKKAWMTRFHSVHNNTCFQVCKHQGQKVFDDAGAFSQTGSDAMIDKIYTDDAQKTSMKAGIAKCAEGLTFSMDNECASYQPFIACMHKTHFELCKIDPAKHKDEEEI